MKKRVVVVDPLFRIRAIDRTLEVDFIDFIAIKRAKVDTDFVLNSLGV